MIVFRYLSGCFSQGNIINPDQSSNSTVNLLKDAVEPLGHQRESVAFSLKDLIIVARRS